ncbi:hypothetical protein SOVF_004330 [Spinacia oleracea]|nr:hypothetical protein SOVF_004330 [Spinacia oleracea]
MASEELADLDDDPSPPGGEGGVKIGPHTIILRSFFRNGLGRGLSSLTSKYGIKPSYMLVEPGEEATVNTRSPGCIDVYVASLEMGLHFPLHPFIPELLNCYGLAICNVSPNSWGSVLCFLMICDMMDISPTLRLWRNLFRLGPVSAKLNGYGWWSFSVRKGYNVISRLVSNQHTFRGEFLYVYNAEPDAWDFALVPTLVEPNLHMNCQVDQMDDTEALVALYLRSRMIVEPCGTVSILPMHWVPGREELKHEEFMCAVGLNHRYPKDLARREDPMASHITKAQLLRAQLQAKIASGALKAPPPPALTSKNRKAEDGQPWSSGDPPFMVISEKDRFKRLTKSMNVLFTLADDEYFEGIPLDDELDGFHMAWAEVSHLEAENQRMESDLEVAEEKSAEWKSTHDGMKAKYMKYKGLYANKKEKVEELKGELSATQAKTKELEDGQASTEGYIEAWKKSEAGVAYLASVGQQSLTVGEESALDKMLAEEEALMSDMLREEHERLSKEDEVGAAAESVTAEAGGSAAGPSSRVVFS